MLQKYNVSTMSKDLAKKACLIGLNELIQFSKELQVSNPSNSMQNAINQMTSIKDDIVNEIPLKHKNVLEKKFSIFNENIIKYQPNTSLKLMQFWNAQKDIMNKVLEKNLPYAPAKKIQQKEKSIRQIREQYLRIARRLEDDLSDEVFLLAFFYVYILRIESLERNILLDFNYLLKQFSLSDKYDVEEIFSNYGKAQSGWMEKEKITKRWRTDARAVRDCLTHNLYELDLSKDPWEIKFDSARKGFEYSQTFDKNTFISFIKDMDLIFQSSKILIQTIFVYNICRIHFL